MDKRDWQRIRGLKRLIHDGVGRGAEFVEKHHRHAAEKPFRVLESIKPIAAPTKLVRGVHDGVLWLTYGGIRVINRATEKVDSWVIGHPGAVLRTTPKARECVPDHWVVSPDSKPSAKIAPGPRLPSGFTFWARMSAGSPSLHA